MSSCNSWSSLVLNEYIKLDTSSCLSICDVGPYASIELLASDKRQSIFISYQQGVWEGFYFFQPKLELYWKLPRYCEHIKQIIGIESTITRKYWVSQYARPNPDWPKEKMTWKKSLWHRTIVVKPLKDFGTWKMRRKAMQNITDKLKTTLTIYVWRSIN